MQTTTKLRQRGSPVFLFNIIQCCHGNHIFVLIGQPHLHILHRFYQIHKDQAHCGLIDPLSVLLTVYKRINDIFQQILDLQHFRNLKMKIFPTLFILTQDIHQKICQHIVISRHGIGHIKKLRQHHKIDRNIILPRFQNLMLRKLIKKKQLTFVNYDFFSINDISQRSLTHIQHFHKIMPVRRKIHKTGVCTHSDQPAFFQHLTAVHGKVPTGCVEISIHLCFSIQDFSLFLCDLSQLIQ